jgi:hypothetical protein
MVQIKLTQNNDGYLNVDLSKDALQLDAEELIALYSDAIAILKSQILSIEQE